MGYGAIYPESWWGNANEANAWGLTYPTNAGGSILTATLIILKQIVQVLKQMHRILNNKNGKTDN